MDDLFGLNDNPIDRFINRFGTVHGHLEMAYHAALPLALTPDLLYLIWANFRSDAKGQPLNMQWVTVADLILSSLCREIRHETYVMETAVRQELLNGMAEDERFGPEYILRLGQFIQHYASQYIQSDIPSLRQFAQAQVWAAQAYTEPDRLLENLAGQYSQQPDEAETMRLADLLEIFSEPLNLDWVPTKVDTLVNFDRLQTFGEGLAKFDRGYQQEAIRQLRRLLGPSRELHIGSVPLPVRSEVAQLLSQQEDKTYTYRIKLEDETTVVVEQIDPSGTTLSIQMGQLALPEENIEIEVPESYTIDRKELEHRLIENFSRDEVNELISDLGLELDQFLTFRTKSSLIRDLIRHFHRRDMLDELLQACHRSKPSVDWTDITDIVENYAPTSAMIFTEMLNNVESGHSNLEQLRSLGKQLFNILFDDTLRVDFLIFLEKAINENAFVRIELEIDNNFLQDVTLLPWELLCLPEGTGFGTNWLAAAPELMLNRLPSETIPETYFLPNGEPIRIALIVGPQAHDDSPLLYDSIWEAYEILANRAPANFTLLPLLIKPTNEQFASLMAQQPHVVHLIIHAQQFETTGEIALIPAREGKKQDSTYLWLDGKELASEINQYDPTLVILQSDESAQPQMLKGMKDVAAVLVEKHTANVVCWQFPVESAIVARFIHTVFPAFAQGIPLDEAIQNGRRALLRDDNPLAFAAPSLFSNTIVRRRTANEPVPRTLPISLGVALAGSGVTTVLEKGEVLPVKSEPFTLFATRQAYHLGLGFVAVQLFQGEMVFGRDNLLLAEVVIDDPDVYSGEIEIEAIVSVNADSSIQFQVNHAASGFSRQVTVSLRDDALIGQPRIQDVAEIINWQLQGVTENYHLATLTAVSDWLNTTDADRVMVITGERSSGKTTLASLLARYFRGDSQPPNNLHALAPISTSAVYFCQPSRPETLHPRSFILTIATQWASRDSHFAYLQPIIDNHEAYELDELVTQLLIKPFTEIDELIYPGSIIFLVDDLDAAIQNSGGVTILDIIFRMMDQVSGTRFLLTTQMRPPVRKWLSDIEAKIITLGDRYENLDIWIGEISKDGRYPIRARSAENKIQTTSAKWRYIETILGQSRGITDSLNKLSSETESAALLSKKVYEFLCPEKIEQILRQVQQYATVNSKQGVRIRLRIADNKLHSYPWELFYNNGAFALDNSEMPVLLERSVTYHGNFRGNPVIPPQVRILIAISTPGDQQLVDLNMLEKKIREGTNEGVLAKQISVRFIRHATLQKLMATAKTFEPDIIHFILPTSQDSKEAIIFENESGNSEVISTSNIVQVLETLSVQFIILSPIGTRQESLAPIASQFVQAGLPAVLVEQFVLPDRPAIEFLRTLYKVLLSDRLPLEEAVWQCRNHLATSYSEPYWSHLALFLNQGFVEPPNDVEEELNKANEVKSKRGGASKRLRILLVEDDENAYDPMMRWLKEESYDVRLATSYPEAKTALETDHFHLMITGSRLVDDDPNDQGGLQLLQDVDKMQLNLTTILCTAVSFSAWLFIFNPDRFILKEAGYLRKLLYTVEELEKEKIKINFELEYVSNSLNVLEDVAEDVNWSMEERPSTKLLLPQVHDLFGKLFFDARSLYVSKLKPSLTGAAVVRIQPTWTGGLGRSYVAKIGRKDKVQTEQRHYEANVKQFLTANAVTQADILYSRHLGMVLYTFGESTDVAFREFDEYYQRSESTQIIASLRELFDQTFRHWFANPERILADVPAFYYDAFHLDQKKLVGRIQTVLPDFKSDNEFIQLTSALDKVLNPVAWLQKHKQECVMQVHTCITHGDLTGRNIMVSDSGKCWLIDFYRTYKSHSLRDFVILETDVKYRLMSLLSLADFIHFEEALLEADRQNQPPILPPSFSKDARKAAEVVFALRQLAHRYASGFNTRQAEVRKEYLLSQLMGTLNVVRLRHISENRKLQAMHSAVMLCEELDMLAGRPSDNRVVDMYREPVPVSQASFAEDSSFFAPALMLATAQQRFLAENVAKDNVVLFIGSAVPRNADWPNIQELALQLMKEVNISASSSDKPTKLFAFYINRTDSRKRLIQKQIDYFDPSKRPSMYQTAAKLPWKTIYTTNQHAYMEQALQDRQSKFDVRIEAVSENVERETTPIHKLYGSLDSLEQEPNKLPITEYDHRLAETVERVSRFWQQLGTDVQQGSFLLMLCPSEDELMSAYQHCQPGSAEGLVWLAGGDISEEEQDVYRNLDFRVLPDTPGQLLKVLFTLTNYDGGNYPGLPSS
ncbi:CHAT domain-containing protein [Candidatus Leptofilum sp.]|uniref:CHAT domain-containing protein n=1 Tax=Candidatus Leptofilum sp. TaxID=3241576 RepID=UPI003B5AF84C